MTDSSPPACGPLIDTHAHLQDDQLRGDLPGVLDRARAAGVVQVVAIGTTADDGAEVVAIAGAHPGVFAAVGVQPNYVAEAEQGDWERIVGLAARPRVVAVGETGLDRYWDHTPFEQQQDWFGRHLRLAHDLDLPVVIHCRDCEADILAQLAALGRPVRGVLHSFTGGIDEARAFVELGLHISFAGMLTYKSKKLDALREAAASVPLDRLLVETDSPYLSPHPLRGRPNQPAHVVWTTRTLAEVRGAPPDAIARAVTANARRLFRLSETDVIPAPGDP
jgi:TatD DNase family protein